MVGVCLDRVLFLVLDCDQMQAFHHWLIVHLIDQNYCYWTDGKWLVKIKCQNVWTKPNKAWLGTIVCKSVKIFFLKMIVMGRMICHLKIMAIRPFWKPSRSLRPISMGLSSSNINVKYFKLFLYYIYLFRFGGSKWGRVWSLVGNCSSIKAFSYLSLSCCFLASSNDWLPLNDGANPLNTLEGGRNGSFKGRFGFFFFNGDLSKIFLKGFFMLILIGFLLGGFDLWSFLSGRWWSRLFSFMGKNSSTWSWLTKFLSLWPGLRLGGPRGGGSPFLFGLINVLITSPSGLQTSKGWHLSGRVYYF